MYKLSRKEPILAAIIIVFLLIRSLAAHSTVDPEAANILKRWLVAECERYYLDRSDLSLEQKAELLEQVSELEFTDVSAHGSANNMVIRVDIEPNPVLPPDTSTVRYFRMKYYTMTGWSQTPQRGSALSYFLAMFLL